MGQGSVVHPVDEGHLDDTEVKNGTSGGDWSEEFSLLVNLDFLFSGLNKLFIDFLRFGLNGSQYIDKLGIIKKGTLGVSETLEELILKCLENLGVARYLFLELLKLLLE